MILRQIIPAADGWRKGAVLVMNDTTYRDLYKIRSAYDRNIWGTDMTGKYPAILLGVPIVICEAMSNADSGSNQKCTKAFSSTVKKT